MSLIKIFQDCAIPHRVFHEIEYIYNIVRLAEKSNELEGLGAVVAPLKVIPVTPARFLSRYNGGSNA